MTTERDERAIVRALLAAIPDPTATVRLDGTVVDANAEVERITGVPADRLQGSDIRLFFTRPQDVMDVLAGAVEQGSAAVRAASVRNISGGTTEVRLSGSRVVVDGEPLAFVIARDDSDAIDAGNRLRAASRYSRSLIEASLDPLVTISVDGKIMDVNRATELATGQPRESLIGSDFSDYFTDPEKARSGYLTVFSEGHVTDYPLVLRRASGELMEVLYNASVYHDEDGRVAGIFAAARDVTLLKRSQLELESTTREVLLLAQMTDLLQSCQSIEESFTIIGMTMERLFPGASGRCLLMAPSGHALEEVARWGDVSPQGDTILPDDCWSLRRGHIHDIGFEDSINPPCRHIAGVTQPYVCVPLLAQGSVLGIIHLIVQDPADSGARSAHVRNLARTTADSISLALANLRLRESMLEMSMRDPLTGLYNRRFMEEALTREISRAERSQQALVVAMLDLDHFKRVNDTFGHEVGDLVLIDVAALMADFRNGVDIACRYGGEEFLLVLPGADVADALPRLEGLREQVSRVRPAGSTGATGGVSLSIGVAGFPRDGHTPATLVKAADTAMYRAKENGRDRIELAPGSAAHADEPAGIPHGV